MKKFLLILICVFVSNFSYSQEATKPSLMVIPSRNWCKANNFLEESTTETGKKVYTPLYREALVNSNQLKTAIATINDLMAKREYPLEDLETSLDQIEEEEAEEMANDEIEVATSLLDQIQRRVKPDIMLELNWNFIDGLGLRKAIHFELRALDSYTRKQITTLQSDSQPATSFDLGTAIRECCAGGFEEFVSGLALHFQGIADNGREISVNIKTEANSGINLSTDRIGEDNIQTVIAKWLRNNCVKGACKRNKATTTSMEFTQVRIPLRGEDGFAIEATDFVQKMCDYFIGAGYAGSMVQTQGLGKATLIISQ
jgi:hypothetical protein